MEKTKLDKMHPQTLKIFAYLLASDKGLTQREAAEKFGCYRLSARIAEIKECGIGVKREWEMKRLPDGTSVRYARYRI